MKRYKNVLFERDKETRMKRSSTELVEFDLNVEVYEKSSPERRVSDEHLNDSMKNTPVPKTSNVKNINVEISKAKNFELEP